MADKNDKLPNQPDGKFYVDSQCIDCNLCRETAPENFKRDDDGGFSFVYKQPISPEEGAPSTICFFISIGILADKF